MMEHDYLKQISLSTDGAGFVIYSPESIVFPEGADFFSQEFDTPQKVAEHIRKGDIVGINTGSAGEYNIAVKSGYPSAEILEQYPVAIRLALVVKGGKVAIIDLLWLTEWSDEVPEEQLIDIADGIYHVTVMTRKPDSGIWGDNQEIYMFFNSIDEMPELKWTGVPYLF
ncbi:hypothetical protein [Butyrivibrio proteoclasticus]|uniref:hypothetical protein n=1 Tax=Butyrivibrio proteoclasticus TaxID=43305 RepID=UPI00047D4382|nr:hypothetical protein [Butyrivibrio proteoclasticus]